MTALVEWATIIGVPIAIGIFYYARKSSKDTGKHEKPKSETLYKHRKPPTGRINTKAKVRKIGGLPRYDGTDNKTKKKK